MNATSSADICSMEEEVPGLTCEICIEPMTENNIFNNENRCGHPFCLDCIVKYIEAEMGENTAEVSCPASNCDNFLDPLSCRPILPSGLFQRWCDVLCESAVIKCESAYCPFPKCSVLILNECGENVTRSECPNCKKLFCFQCKIPWHMGFECNDAKQLRDENDILFGELVEKNKWMRCPGCNFHIEKIEGCRNIICRCRVHFCYSCGKIQNSCECNRGNVPFIEPPMPFREPPVPFREPPVPFREPFRMRDDTNVAKVRDCFTTLSILLINVLFRGLIVGLYMIKGSDMTIIFATILFLCAYILFVLPMSIYAIFCL